MIISRKQYEEAIAKAIKETEERQWKLESEERFKREMFERFKMLERRITELEMRSALKKESNDGNCCIPVNGVSAVN